MSLEGSLITLAHSLTHLILVKVVCLAYHTQKFRPCSDRPVLLHIILMGACFFQLFRERLSYKRGKAYATMSKVIMGNIGFDSCLSEPRGVSAWWKETAQTRIHSFSFYVAESPWTSIKQSQTFTTHNANRHCCVCFYTFLGQPLLKQLYIVMKFWRWWSTYMY